MTINTKIKTDIQSQSAGSPRVNLFTVDATGIGGSVYYITPGTLGGAAVVFNAQTYTPLPVIMEGVKLGADGKLPRPKITIENISKAFQAEVVTYNDLVGAVVTRVKTYQKYLDGQAGADPNATYQPDVFIIKRKIKGNKILFQFELRAPMDLEYVMLPGGQILPDCGHTYRVWNGASFDYTKTTCPYTDTDYYDATGAATSAANDQCGLDLYSCRNRFPSTNNTDDQLPMDGFPGVGQIGSPYRR